MKKIITLFAILGLTIYFGKAQDTIAGWTFPTGTSADAYPDIRITQDSALIISTNGGTSVINYKNGNPTFAAQAIGWDNGANLKCWQIIINTNGYKNLKLNSMQQSGGSYPGPRDYKVQYQIGSSGAWTDVPGAAIKIANDWTTGVLSNVEIPAACNNQDSVFLRWIMTSDTSSTPPALVISTGTTKIDNIIITGTSSSSNINELTQEAFSFYPNPARSTIFINFKLKSNYEIFSIDGMLLKTGILSKMIDVSDFYKGIYLFEIKNENGKFIKKLIIQ
jgi:hypothetical protein